MTRHASGSAGGVFSIQLHLACGIFFCVNIFSLAYGAR